MYHKDPNIHLTKLKDILGYRDMRSVIEWCEKNGVYILRQGNKQVVNTAEFILSYYKPFINHLQTKHQNWKEYFINYLEGNIKKLITETIAIQSHIINANSPIQSITYTNARQKTKNKTSPFLNILKNL
jgi:hypothetical protein